MFERLLIGIAFVGITCSTALADGWIATVPGPIVGAGIPGLVAAGVGAYAWYRRRSQQ